MKRLVIALVFVAQFAMSLSPALASQTTTVNKTDYTLVNVRKTRTIGDPQMGGAEADGVFVILTFNVVNQSDKTRDISLSTATLEDDAGNKYSTSSEGETALSLSGEKSAEFLLSEIQPHVPKKVSVVFEVPPSSHNFTVTIPKSMFSFSRNGTLTFSI